MGNSRLSRRRNYKLCGRNQQLSLYSYRGDLFIQARSDWVFQLYRHNKTCSHSSPGTGSFTPVSQTCRPRFSLTELLFRFSNLFSASAAVGGGISSRCMKIFSNTFEKTFTDKDQKRELMKGQIIEMFTVSLKHRYEHWQRLEFWLTSKRTVHLCYNPLEEQNIYFLQTSLLV